MLLKDGRYNEADEAEFFTGFLEASERQRQEYRDIDREVLENYFVLPYEPGYDWGRSKSILKDTETHQIIETLLANALLTTISDEGFCHAIPVGTEDVRGAKMVQALEENVFRKSGNTRSMYVHWKDAFLFGAAVLFPTWAYEEGYGPSNFVTYDPLTGQESVNEILGPRVYQDDVELIPLDLDDFYPEPGHDTCKKMLFAARRYFITLDDAQRMVDQGRWNPQATRDGCHAAATMREEGDRLERTSIDRPQENSIPEAWYPKVVYEGYGMVPYKHRDGVYHRRLTMLGGKIVESRPMPINCPRRVPFYETVINPVQGRFRGVAPGAVARFTQSFTDSLLMCLADGVVRKTTLPVVYDRSRIPPTEISKLLSWKGPIASEGVDSIKELNYNPPLADAWNMLSMAKSQMQQATSASSQIQGQGFGTKRMSASEASFLGDKSMDRLELTNKLLEHEALPAVGQAILMLCQQFIQNPQDLAKRVGSSYVEPGFALSALNAEYDIAFVGSQRIQNKQLQLQLLERGMQIFGSIPGAAPNYPWALAMAKWLRVSGQRDLEAAVSNPDAMLQFLELQSMGGGQSTATGNGNATVAQPPQAIGAAQGLGSEMVQ